VDGVLQLILVVTAPISDGLPGGVSHIITDRCSEGCPLALVEDPRPEDLCNCIEFHPPWMWDSLDLVSLYKCPSRGDAQVSQQSVKPAGGDQSCSTEGFPFISIFVQLLTLVVTQG
jgi:hypothetical protein